MLSVNDQSIGLMRRNEHGIWPNLWFLPLYETEMALIGAHPQAHQQFSLTHKLTHRILQIHVYLIDRPINLTAIEMVSRQALLNRPHPKALIHILNQHDNLT